MSKRCNQCGEHKDYSEFNKHSIMKDGYASICKICKRSNDKEYRDNNIELKKQRDRKYYKENKDKVYKRIKEWRVENKHKLVHRDERVHREGINRAFSKYVCKIRQQVKKINSETNIKHSLDHIIPLFHKDVCGLDVPWNMQILTHQQNCIKSNKFDGTYDNESWRKDARDY